MQVFDNNNICCEVIKVGMLGTNCYIVYNKESKAGCVIDPGGEADKIMAFINANDIRVENIYLTHGHFDHIMMADEIRKRTGAQVAIFEKDYTIALDTNGNCAYMVSLELTMKADKLLTDGEKVPFAGALATVINTPGHTAGSCCYYLEDMKVLFSGDTLFFESYGRTDLPTGSMSDMVHSLKEKLFFLPEDVTAYPGHGAFTSIGYEKDNLDV